jgi:hypothetical protein
MTTTPGNIFACLVHEAPDCVADLVANLRYCDPDSLVLVYDGGGPDGPLGNELVFDDEGVVVYPWPQQVRWGWLHDFAIDCMRFAVECVDFATITFVDSDQLAVRRGYSEQLAGHLSREPHAGCLVSTPGVQPDSTLLGPAQAAWQEMDLWRPFLRRFPSGEDRFPHWTFWPATVFTRDAAASIVELSDDEDLRAILGRSSLWASEEVLLASLAALAGHEVAANPFSHPAVRYRKEFSPSEVDEAMADPACWWVHPVARTYHDPVRSRVRASLGGYRPLPATSPGARRTAAMPSQPRPHNGGLVTPVRRVVSCVLPVTGRRAEVAEAIGRFLAGEPGGRPAMGDCELLIVDDGPDAAADLVPEDARIRYVRLTRPESLVTKRNIGCALAWGEVIEHWDGAGPSFGHRRRLWELQPFTP